MARGPSGLQNTAIAPDEVATTVQESKPAAAPEYVVKHGEFIVNGKTVATGEKISLPKADLEFFLSEGSIAPLL